MYTVEVSAVLRPGHRLTDDEITDLVEAIIEDLDATASSGQATEDEQSAAVVLAPAGVREPRTALVGDLDPDMAGWTANDADLEVPTWQP